MTPLHRRRLGVLVGIALLFPLVVQSAASGDPIDDTKAQAVQIQNQLDAQGKQVSIADEQFNRAQLHLTDVQNSLAAAQANLQRSDDRLASVKSLLAQAAVNAYVDGGSSSILSRLARSGDQNNLIVRSQYLQVAANDQRAIMDDLRTAKEDYAAQKVKLTADQKDAQAAADAAAAGRRSAIAAEDAQRTILSKVQGDLAGLVAAESARRLAADAAKAPAAIANAPLANTPVAAAAPSGIGVQSASAPAVSSGAAIAVKTAVAQLGKPYVYGGSGPNSFDCSGLTSFAWRAAGVSLSHDAYQQWFETSRVSLDNVQPGDLLFFGDNGVESIHHVAMYVGNGQMIEAAETGIPVRYRGWRASDLIGAGRPG